mmetsp:Transcript_1799/g.1993  ORF Transcript_1799/g.1993 Transcript_1799/m.1993 type:complete len:158 (+) Transcript_1799:24-497(+)
MLGGNDIYVADTEPEKAMEVKIIRPYTRVEYDQLLRRQATKTVLWKKCLNFCDLDRNEVEYFNKAFYTEKKEEGQCAFTCFNDRIIAHLGKEEAYKHDMLYNWDNMTQAYQNLREINPVNKKQQFFDKTKSEEDQERMLAKLERQAKKMKTDKFDFY